MWPPVSFQGYVRSSGNLFPHIILPPVSPAFASCKGLKRFLCTGLTRLGGRVDLGGVQMGLQPFDLSAAQPHRFTQRPQSAPELPNCAGSSRSTKCRFPHTHLHLMSINLPPWTSPRAVASSHPLLCVCRVLGRASL